MIYKNTYEVIKPIRRNARCSSGKLLLLFHYINMLTYSVVYKILLSYIVSYFRYHILFKPSINYNYFADTIKE